MSIEPKRAAVTASYAATMIIAGALFMGAQTTALAQSTPDAIRVSSSSLAAQSASTDGEQLAMKERADVFYRDPAGIDRGQSVLAIRRSNLIDRAPKFTLLDDASTARFLHHELAANDYFTKEPALDENRLAREQNVEHPLFSVSVGGWELPVFMRSTTPSE